MKVRVKLFAVACQLVGRSEIQVVVPANATVADLRRGMAEQFPAIAPVMPHVMIAVDADYADEQVPIGSDSEIACIPPVSGG